MNFSSGTLKRTYTAPVVHAVLDECDVYDLIAVIKRTKAGKAVIQQLQDALAEAEHRAYGS